MISVQQAIRTFIVAIGAFLLYDYLHWAQGYWIVLTALFLIQIRLNDFFRKNISAILLSGLLIAINVSCVFFISPYFYLLALYFFVTTFLSVYVSYRNPNYFLAAFFINVCGVLSIGAQHDVANSVLCGTGVAILGCALIWPPRVKKNLQLKLACTLQGINRLQAKLFFIYFKRDYAERHYVYEKELHVIRMQIFTAINQARSLINKIPSLGQAHYQAVIGQLDMLIELVIALGNLRYRIRDYSTFELCEKEFKSITAILSATINNISAQLLGKKIVANENQQLQTSIEAFEDVYRNTLVVVSKEPLDFLIFIQNLSAMDEVLSSLLCETQK